jgi:RNA polymerase sigma factor (TIGR02999 family)
MPGDELMRDSLDPCFSFSPSLWYLETSMSDVTRILHAMESGDARAADELLPLVYDELRKLAAHRMAQEQPGHTLQPTALVHEAWLRLVTDGNPRFEGRGHFFAAAAEAMRRILVDRAREKMSLKRGARAERVNLDELEVAVAADDETLLALDDALAKLAKEDADSAEFIKLKFFAGLTNAQAAQTLGIPERTARRHWSFARVWLYRELRKSLGA